MVDKILCLPLEKKEGFLLLQGTLETLHSLEHLGNFSKFTLSPMNGENWWLG